MRRIALVLMMIGLIVPSLALTEYQRGVLDGLAQGWSMAQRYDQALGGDIASYNQAVPKYNAWIESIFGRNESLMLKNITETAQAQPYSIHKTFTPVHSIDASWNQTPRTFQETQPQPNAYGMIYGYPAETYYSIGPALSSF
ncbi:MAG: hypothetical protein GYA39_05435 [Methanothrix sp.]|nr:hypothetical protein [Methanothrix sp.]